MRTVTLTCGVLLALSPVTISAPWTGEPTARQSDSATAPPPHRDSRPHRDPVPHRDWADPLGSDEDAQHAVVRPFDRPTDPYAPGHRGVDLAGRPGQRVHSAAAGVVSFAGPVAGRPVVTIAHDGGMRTTYLPVRPSVTKGQRVRRAQVIGNLRPGHPECGAPSGRVCLHWGLRSSDGYLDPLASTGRFELRLLPW